METDLTLEDDHTVKYVDSILLCCALESCFCNQCYINKLIKNKIKLCGMLTSGWNDWQEKYWQYFMEVLYKDIKITMICMFITTEVNR